MIGKLGDSYEVLINSGWQLDPTFIYDVPMRILLLSDIHNNVSAVQKMRGQEANTYDLVVVAGDIGSDRAQEVFDVLATFQCPVAYIYGNWDSRLTYERSFGIDCHHLHLAPFTVGNLTLAGFSGCTAHWGQNPVAERLRAELNDANREIINLVAAAEDEERLSTASIRAESAKLIDDLINVAKTQKSTYKRKLNLIEKERDAKLESASRKLLQAKKSVAYDAYLKQSSDVSRLAQEENRAMLSAVVRQLGSDIARTVIVTHDRLTRTQEDFAGVPLFLFGHRHGFSDRSFQGARYINVSVLDKGQLVRPLKFLRGDRFAQHRNIHAGNYVVLEWTEIGGFSVVPKHFEPPEAWQASWETVPDMAMPRAEFLS